MVLPLRYGPLEGHGLRAAAEEVAMGDESPMSDIDAAIKAASPGKEDAE